MKPFYTVVALSLTMLFVLGCVHYAYTSTIEAAFDLNCDSEIIPDVDDHEKLP